MRRPPLLALLFLLVAALLGPAPAAALKLGEMTEEEKAEARAETRTMARETLQKLYAVEPSARARVEGAAGYAVFSNFGMKLLVTGSARGRGIAVDTKGVEVFMRMVEVQAGLGFGVKKFRLVWVFETPAAFRRFVDDGFEVGAQAQAAAKGDSGGGSHGGALSVSPGVWLYQLTDKGIVAELTVKGTKYYRDKDLD